MCTIAVDAQAERREMEAAVRDSEARYRTLFESIDEGFCVVEVIFDDADRPVDYLFLEVNPALARRTGIENAVGLRIRQIAPHHEELWFTMFGSVALTGEPVRFESQARAFDDGIFEVYAFRVGKPEQRQVAVLLADITKRKRAEEALRRSHQRLAWVLEKTGLGIWLNELPFGQLNWDEQTKKLFFVASDLEPTIDLFWSRLHPADVERTRLAVEQAIRDHTLYFIEHRVVHPDTGDIRWICSIGQATYGADGTPTLFDGISYDITDRKQTEETLKRHTKELESLDKANRRLLREVNHRVKNSLTAILGLIYAEQRRLDAEAPVHGGLPRCQAALNDLGERVRSLATVHGLLSSGAWRPLRIDVLAGEVIRESLPAGEDWRNLNLDLTGAPVLITPEQAHHLALIIGELTTNTVKYGRSRGRLQISVDVGLKDGEVRFIYRNDGPGYPDHILAGQGYSVGLSLVHTLSTHSLRGTWSVRNENGAVTEIRFPVNEVLPLSEDRE